MRKEKDHFIHYLRFNKNYTQLTQIKDIIEQFVRTNFMRQD